jgi:hypothetical protein
MGRRSTVKFEWSEQINFGANGSYRALLQDNVEIADVSCLDKAFVQMLIDKHNNAINETASIWALEGAKIASQVKNK